MLNRKYADFRHAPELDPRVLVNDPAKLPQSVAAIGPGATKKTKGGVVLAEPGYVWAVFFFPGRWYTISSIYEARGSLVAHHVDLCVPPEEVDGVLTFLDLKLDLLIRASGERTWLDQDDYDRELAADSVSPAWQDAVARTRAELDRECAAGTFPPPAVAQYRPPDARERS